MTAVRSVASRGRFNVKIYSSLIAKLFQGVKSQAFRTFVSICSNVLSKHYSRLSMKKTRFAKAQLLRKSSLSIASVYKNFLQKKLFFHLHYIRRRLIKCKICYRFFSLINQYEQAQVLFLLQGRVRIPSKGCLSRNYDFQAASNKW